MFFLSVDVSDVHPASWRYDLFAEMVAVTHKSCAGEAMVAFPQMIIGDKATLGAEMRIFGTEKVVSKLINHDEFRAISQTIQHLKGVISVPLQAPKSTEYKIYFRDRRVDRGGNSRQKRMIKRGNSLAGLVPPTINLPYFRIVSLSTERMMPIYVREETVSPDYVSNGVGSFGLSTSLCKTAVPHF